MKLGFTKNLESFKSQLRSREKLKDEYLLVAKHWQMSAIKN